MARSFGPETSVLMYQLRPHADPGKHNERAWLLWPAWAYRVVAPRVRRGRLNLLQQAVLGILRAGRLTAAELGFRLGIHAELAEFVVSELQRQRHVDESWKVTRSGIEQLDQEEEEQEESQTEASLMSGWVFRDPWTENLWPFIAPSLEHTHTEPGPSGFPEIVLGTAGNPRRQRAWMQHRGIDRKPVAPDASEILRAAARHWRLERRTGGQKLWMQEEEPPHRPSLCLSGVSTIEPEPEPVFLVTYLYVPRSGSDGEYDWHACDFFGRGSNPELRKLIVRVAEQDRGLESCIDRILRNTIYGTFDEFRRAAAQYRGRANQLLERVLTLDIWRHAVAEPLVEMLAAWLEVAELDDGADGGRHRTVLVSCRRVLERLFRQVANKWPLAGVADRLSPEPEINRARLKAAADAVGFDEVPETLLRVSQGQVRSAAGSGGHWRLGPLVAATLLRAVEDMEHPLRLGAVRAPDLLVRIDRVAAQAGAAAHDGDGRCFDRNAIKDCVDTTIEITGHLLGLPVRSIRE